MYIYPWCMYIYTHISVCIYIYIYIHISADPLGGWLVQICLPSGMFL